MAVVRSVEKKDVQVNPVKSLEKEIKMLTKALSAERKTVDQVGREKEKFALELVGSRVTTLLDSWTNESPDTSCILCKALMHKTAQVKDTLSTLAATH